MSDQVTGVDDVARKTVADLAEVVRVLLGRVQELETYIHQEPEPDPATVAFLSYRDKARGVVRRLREKGQIE